MFTFCSNLLHCFISLSCVVTFIATAASGLLLILASKEPSLLLGGGDVHTLVLGIVLLLVAIVTIPLGVYGCLSVYNDSSKRLIIYTVIAVIVSVIILLCSSVLFTFTYTNTISNSLNSTLWTELRKPDNSSDTSKIFEIQENYDCCGVTNHTNWFDPSTNWSKSSHQHPPPSYCSSSNMKYPVSCYSSSNSSDSCIHQKGCKDALLLRLKVVVDVSFGVAIAASFLQLLTAGLTCYGNKVISKYKHYDIF